MQNSNTNTKREGHREHEQRNRGGGGRERVRGREKETERERERFFNSCKPFLLCSGLTTETGRERRRESVLSTTELERKDEELGLRGTLFQMQYRIGSRINTLRQEQRVLW